MLFIKPPNNLFLYQVNSLISFLIISLYFHAKWKGHSKNFRPGQYYRLFFFITLLLLAMILYEDLEAYNSSSASLVALLISIYASIYYFSKLNKPEVENITSTRSFWFVTGLFLYYGGVFYFFKLQAAFPE